MKFTIIMALLGITLSLPLYSETTTGVEEENGLQKEQTVDASLPDEEYFEDVYDEDYAYDDLDGLYYY